MKKANAIEPVRAAAEHTPEPDELASAIARARRLVWTAAARRLEAHGESILAWQVFNQLNRHGRPLSQNELAFLAGQHAAGLSRLLDGLESSGDVRRTRDSEDRRRVLVELTEAGHARFLAMQPHLRQSSGRVLQALSETDRRDLKRLLDKLIAQFG